MPRERTGHSPEGRRAPISKCSRMSVRGIHIDNYAHKSLRSTREAAYARRARRFSKHKSTQTLPGNARMNISVAFIRLSALSSQPFALVFFSVFLKNACGTRVAQHV